MRLGHLLDELRGRGVVLAADGDQLRFRSPKGAITPAEREFLGGHRAEVLALLRGDTVIGTATDDPADRGRSGGGVGTLSGSSQKSRKSQKRSKKVLTPPGEPFLASHKSQKNSIARDSANCAISAIGTLKTKGEATRIKTRPKGGNVTISGRTFPYFFWDGQRLGGDRLGFDTETAVIVENEVPELALASASSGDEHCLIHPDRLAKFLMVHRDHHFMLFHCAFDFWVVAEFLAGRGEADAIEVWRTIVDDGRMHDAMLLDELIRLGRTDAYPRSRNLGEVAHEYAGLGLDKNDPYRLRYGEVIGADWSEVEEGFFTYAVKDPIATLLSYEVMVPQAVTIMGNCGLDPTDTIDQFGPLSETIQVHGAVALEKTGFLGMHLETARLDPIRAGLQRRRDELVAALEAEPSWEGVVRRDRQGQIVLTAKTKAPAWPRTGSGDCSKGPPPRSNGRPAAGSGSPEPRRTSSPSRPRSGRSSPRFTKLSICGSNSRR